MTPFPRSAVRVEAEVNIDGAMLMTSLEKLSRKTRFKPLIYLNDVLEYPLPGIIVQSELLRDKPDQVKKVLSGALRWIVFTKSRREEVVPLPRGTYRLETLDMAQKSYDKLRDIWSDNGMPSEKV